MKKNYFVFPAFFSTVILLAGCGGEKPTNEIKDLVEFDEIALYGNTEIDYDNSVFDDFTNGVSKNNWYISNTAWGQGNGGVIPENVFYTDDGYLVLRANGNHYAKGEVKGVGDLKDGRNTGSVLISKFTCLPGRYESRFIPIVRQGNCTAMWTFAYKQNENGVPSNHEIDIELPGGSSTGTISFKKCLFTNWLTETDKMSQDVLMEEATHGKTINLNDGQFHTFGFDWYTDPAMIVYYIDGYITAINTGFVPDMQTRIWLGNWFPKQGSFVGVSDFETEYMVVDWFKYLPFKDQPYTPYITDPGNVATDAQYPSSPISLPKGDWVSNGDFEYSLKTAKKEGYGWSFSHLSAKPASKENTDVELVVGEGQNGTVGAKIAGNAYLYSLIDSVYGGYEYDFSFDYKSENDGLICYVTFLDVTGGTVEEKAISLPASSEYTKKEVSITAPSSCYNVKLEFCNLNDRTLTNVAYIDNVSMVRK